MRLEVRSWIAQMFMSDRKTLSTVTQEGGVWHSLVQKKLRGKAGRCTVHNHSRGGNWAIISEKC